MASNVRTSGRRGLPQGGRSKVLIDYVRLDDGRAFNAGSVKSPWNAYYEGLRAQEEGLAVDTSPRGRISRVTLAEKRKIAKKYMAKSYALRTTPAEHDRFDELNMTAEKGGWLDPGSPNVDPVLAKLWMIGYDRDALQGDLARSLQLYWSQAQKLITDMRQRRMSEEVYGNLARLPLKEFPAYLDSIRK